MRLVPVDAAELADMVASAVAEEAPLEIVGAGTKRALGRPTQTRATLSLEGFSGISLYEPEELVMAAGAGTALGAIESALDARRQMLAFEPPDLGPLLGAPAGGQTIGGVFACNLAGPRRVKAGAARDHLLGAEAVSGRGEPFRTGGRVVKNVTGYDLCKVLCGSWGTLAAMHMVTFKVLPAPETATTVVLGGLGEDDGIAAIGRALAGPFEVSGAAHWPASAAAAVPALSGVEGSATALRVEGPAPSVRARADGLERLLGGMAPIRRLDAEASRELWRAARDVLPFAREQVRAVWRLSVPPVSGAQVAARIRTGIADAEILFDWGGGLLWVAVEPGRDAAEPAIRAAIGPTGGHATLIRAAPDIRARVAVFEPGAPGLAALATRLKDAFDPKRILNPGRMTAGR